MDQQARYWIDKLQLAPHPEGGYYRVTYRADLSLFGLPPRFSGARPASTSIYFLLNDNDFSAFHRLQSDELWHFYAGGELVVHVIDSDGSRSDLYVGPGNFQAVAKAGAWFGSRLSRGSGFALVGCTVAPGFDFADFELARRDALTRQYPEHTQLIAELTRI